MNRFPASPFSRSRSRAQSGTGRIGAFGRVVYVGSWLCFSAFSALAACSASRAPAAETGSCGLDTSLTCAPGTAGYSCTGEATPDQSNTGLTCSPSRSGSGAYCCVTDTCTPSNTVPCGAGETGYSCSFGAVSPASAVFTCTLTTASNIDLYCCTSTTTETCSVDLTVSCQVGSGYTCPATSRPEDAETTLICSPGQASGEFCCVPGGDCTYDASLGCESGAAGFSCTGTSAPSSVDSALVCDPPMAGANATQYCCK